MNTYVQQLKEEYERRLRVSERTLHGEKERRRQLLFHCKQLEAQLRKVQQDNESMGKQLKLVRKCASCSHLDQRSKSYNALNELLHGSAAALEPDVIASVCASSHDDELKAVKIANKNLQQCVDKLQAMLLQKGREALTVEKYYNDAILEREQQISRLQKEANQHTARKLEVLLKERTELLNRINRLENENKNTCNVVHNESQNAEHLVTTPPVFETDVNPYCGCCQNRVKTWNKMLSGKQVDLTDFVNSDGRSVSYCMKQAMTFGEKIQKLSFALKMEKEKSKAAESALRNENNNLSSSYQKLLQQYEYLETELSKRRIAEKNAESKADEVGRNSSNVDVRLISQLKNELGEADRKIAYLEEELALAKRAVSGNEQHSITRQFETLEKDKRELIRVIDNQRERLNHFEEQLRIVKIENEALQRKCAELDRANALAVQEKLEQVEIIERQRKELSRLEEKQIEKTKAYDAQILVYQQLIKQKNNECGALIAELCAANRLGTQIYDSISETENCHTAADEKRGLLKEMRELNQEKQAMSDKVTDLESELQSLKDQLKLKTEEVGKEVLLKNSMHDDLAKARTMILEKEAQILDLSNELKVAEVKVMKLETELANAADRLQLEQITGSTLKLTVEELEDLLQKKNTELISAAQERQQCTGEMHKLKELKYDLETKLTLQGRELKEARGKLAALRKKVRELEPENVNSRDKSSPEETAQQENSRSTALATTTMAKPVIPNTNPLHSFTK